MLKLFIYCATVTVVLSLSNDNPFKVPRFGQRKPVRVPYRGYNLHDYLEEQSESASFSNENKKEIISFPKQNKNEVPNYPKQNKDEVLNDPKQKKNEIPNDTKQNKNESPKKPKLNKNESPNYPKQNKNETPKYPKQNKNESPNYHKEYKNESPNYHKQYKNESPKYSEENKNERPNYPNQNKNERPNYPKQNNNESPNYHKEYKNESPKYPKQNEKESPLIENEEDYKTRKYVIISDPKYSQYVHPPTEVCSKAGCVRGKAEHGRNMPYEAFYGIPYAEPPVGKLRFENPVPHKGWKGYWDATHPGSACTQRNVFIFTQPIVGSEDCLYLNVYRPTQHKHVKNLPVMIYIHGGSLVSSSSSPDEVGPEYFMDNGQVILVTLNYRLGMFGFLCSGDETVKGNFGLKDQQLALKWVAANIEAFGGDPHSITLFGKGAGAVSAHYHMMNPVSSKLFDRIILMSGTAISHWAFSYDWELKFRLSAKYNGLEGWDTATTHHLAQKMKKLDPISLVLALDLHFTLPITPAIPLTPCIEGDWDDAFLREDPRKIWAEGRYVPKPILIGTTSDEGAIVAPIPTNKTRLELFNDNIYSFLPIQLDLEQKDVEKVLDYYLGKDFIDKSNVGSYYKMVEDRSLVHPMVTLVDQYLKYANVLKNPIFLYEFAFKSPFTFVPIATGVNVNLGVGHHDDLLYLFTTTAFFPIFPSNTPEGLMADTYVKTFTAFAARGEVKSWVSYRLCTQNTNKPLCDRQVFKRLEKKGPDSIIVSVSDQINGGMVKFWNRIDREREFKKYDDSQSESSE